MSYSAAAGVSVRGRSGSVGWVSRPNVSGDRRPSLKRNTSERRSPESTMPTSSRAGPDRSPDSESPPLQAMFYRPGDLRGELAVPLAATVPPTTPRPGQLARAKAEVKRIQALTDSNLFRARFQRSQDAGIYLVLER